MTFFFFSDFFFNPRGISVGAFSGVGNTKTWGSSPEMPKTGSPLAKGELRAQQSAEKLGCDVRPKHTRDRDAQHTPARAWRTRRRAIGLECYGYLDPRGH